MADLAAHGTEREWFDATGHCGECGMFAAEPGKRYDPDALSSSGYPIAFCTCTDCPCGPHPRPLWTIPGQMTLCGGP